ncbi:hypothetical protein H2198_002693 [Neophaeococcomyces mojaviensis]|uniref:Uncharacterized protein n=1 Tax=Neophaeococcomyces mojaviensis TaxID=3383035 RepID=A0ACC3ADW2_9EURO|nr:hypothetical protein H2198_002693 [Knufia sp. JES_112]
MPPTNVWSEYADKLAGGWKCLTFEIYDSDAPDAEPVYKPHGDAPLGRVLLSRNGYLSAHLSVPSLISEFQAKDSQWRSAPDAEVAKVARGLAMYCGYLELFREADGSLWWQTRCDIMVDPKRVGKLEKRRLRYFEEGGKQFMVLQPINDEVTPGTAHTRAVLKWEKFEDA